MTDLAPDILEKEFEQQVKGLARQFGWLYYHTWRSIHSPSGFPDCCLVKGSRLIFAELKTEKGKISLDQGLWLEALRGFAHCEVYLWRPSMYREITRILSGCEVIG